MTLVQCVLLLKVPLSICILIEHGDNKISFNAASAGNYLIWVWDILSYGWLAGCAFGWRRAAMNHENHSSALLVP